MSRLLRLVGLAAAMVFAFAATTMAQQAPPQGEERIASFAMAWPSRKPEAVRSRARSIAEVVAGRELGRTSFAPTRGQKADAGRIRLNVSDAPELEIVYLPNYDELRIVNTELAASTAPEREVPQEEAVNVAKRVFDDLARRKLVEARHYDWNKADVASTWIGSGSVDGKTAERRRTEYRITVRHSINGIELANAGVRIAVHASGRVSALRLGGVGVMSRVGSQGDEPTGKGRWMSRRAADSELSARFQREVVPEKARAKIAWSRVMYVMPEGRRSAVVEPLYVVSYSLEFPTDDGEVSISRRKTVGLSLADREARPTDLTPPMRKPVMDRKRKAG